MNVCSLGWGPLSASMDGGKVARPPRVANSVLIRCWGSTQSQKNISGIFPWAAGPQGGWRQESPHPAQEWRKDRRVERTLGASNAGFMQRRPGNKMPGQRGASQTSGSKLEQPG